MKLSLILSLVVASVLIPAAEAMASASALMPIDFYKDSADQARQLAAHTRNSIEISVLTSEEATQLFNQFKTDKQIPWSFSTDGCYARATAMTLLADASGVTMGKVFAYGNLSHNWQYHVAPVAYVNGSSPENLMVFDPSLFPGPVSIDSWNSILDPNWEAHEKTGHFTWGRGSRFQYKPHGYAKTNYDKADLDNAKETLKKESRH